MYHLSLNNNLNEQKFRYKFENERLNIYLLHMQITFVYLKFML